MPVKMWKLGKFGFKDGERPFRLLVLKARFTNWKLLNLKKGNFGKELFPKGGLFYYEGGGREAKLGLTNYWAETRGSQESLIGPIQLNQGRALGLKEFKLGGLKTQFLVPRFPLGFGTLILLEPRNWLGFFHFWTRVYSNPQEFPKRFWGQVWKRAFQTRGLRRLGIKFCRD